MYGVDRFPQVRAAIERLLALKTTVPDCADISLAFRTSDWQFTTRFRKELAEYRSKGAYVSHIWAYANYAGQVETGAKIGLTILDSKPDKQKTCIFPRIHAAVCWDGSVTACACTDLEGSQLRIGRLDREPLAEILTGEKRAGVLASFGKGALAQVCNKCSAYQSDADFSEPCFCAVQPGRQLPLAYFRTMMT
jgi:hypothetical protein